MTLLVLMLVLPYVSPISIKPIATSTQSFKDGQFIITGKLQLQAGASPSLVVLPDASVKIPKGPGMIVVPPPGTAARTEATVLMVSGNEVNVPPAGRDKASRIVVRPDGVVYVTGDSYIDRPDPQPVFKNGALEIGPGKFTRISQNVMTVSETGVSEHPAAQDEAPGLVMEGGAVHFTGDGALQILKKPVDSNGVFKDGILEIGDGKFTRISSSVVTVSKTGMGEGPASPDERFGLTVVRDGEVVVSGDGLLEILDAPLIGGDGHDNLPHSLIGGDGHDNLPHSLVGGDGHDNLPHGVSVQDVPIHLTDEEVARQFAMFSEYQ